MRHAVALLLAGLAASTLPAAAETVWVGNAMVVGTPPTVCGTTVGAGDFYRILYRPAGTALGNGADSHLSINGQRATFTMFVPNNTFRAAVNYSGRYVSSYLNFGTANGAVTAWAMSPSTLAATTTTANLAMTITNFYNITGCTVAFRSDLELSP